MTRILLLSSLFPNTIQPRKGQFVLERLRQIRQRSAFGWQVIAPVPWFPFGHGVFGTYGQFARVPPVERWQDDEVWHPRYLQVPKVGDAYAPIGYARSVGRWIQRHRLDFDVIDAHFFFPDGVAATLLGRQLGKPVAITARGSDINYMPDEAAAGRWIRWAARHCDRLIAVSRPIADRLVELSGGRHVVLAPNGVDTDRFKPGASREELKRRLGVNGPLILSAGNLIELKGHDLAVEAAARLPGATLIVAGDGPQRSRLEALAARLHSTDRVRFLGSVPQDTLIECYRAADVLVLASRSEGSPNVVLEALACGTPVVSTAPSAVPEGPAGEDVALVERSVPVLTEGIRRVLSSPPDRQGVRRRALSLGWDATCGVLLEVFEELSHSPSAAAA